MKYRIPVTLNAVVEFEDGLAVGLIDTSSMEYSPFHKVTPYGDDADVVEMVITAEDGSEVTAVEADVNIVIGIRDAVGTIIEWRVE